MATRDGPRRAGRLSRREPLKVEVSSNMCGVAGCLEGAVYLEGCHVAGRCRSAEMRSCGCGGRLDYHDDVGKRKTTERH